MGDHGGIGDGAGRAGAASAEPSAAHPHGRTQEAFGRRESGRDRQPAPCPGQVQVVSRRRSGGGLQRIWSGGRTGLRETAVLWRNAGQQREEQGGKVRLVLQSWRLGRLMMGRPPGIEIVRRAYELWEQAGKPEGRDQEFYLQ